MSAAPTDLDGANSREVVARWPARFAADALALRMLAGAQIAIDEQHAWLRVSSGVSDLAGLAGLRGLETFVVESDLEPLLLRARLTDGAAVSRVPSASLPHEESLSTPWGLLTEWRTPRLADALSRAGGAEMEAGMATGSVQSPGVYLHVVRGGALHSAAALMLPLKRLVEWADMAPERRFHGLVFAARANGEALVLGALLPPLPGGLYWLDPWAESRSDGGLLLPCGHCLAPALPARAAFEVLQRSASGFNELTRSGDYVAFDQAGWSMISESSWVRMSRSALRESYAGLAARQGGVDE